MRNTKVRADGKVYVLRVSVRDVRLLDGGYFFQSGKEYRRLFGLNFFRGLKPKEIPIVTHKRATLLVHLRMLLRQFEDERDLLSYDYSYSFGNEPTRRYGAARSGLLLADGYAHITVRPAGYCTLKIFDRETRKLSTIIDMRVRREVATMEKGILKSHRRKAEVGWFEQLPPLIQFLSDCSGDTAEIIND